MTLDGVSLDAISVGDRVAFSLQQDGGNWRISAIATLEDEAMDHSAHQMPPDDAEAEAEPHAGHGDHQ